MEHLNNHFQWQKKLLHTIEISAIGLSAGIMAINITANRRSEAIVGLACIILFSLISFFTRKTAYLMFRLHSFLVVGFCGCLFSIANTGYIHSDAMIWLPAFPVIAIVAGSRPSGRIWMVLCLTAILTIAFAEPISWVHFFTKNTVRFSNFFAITLVLGLFCLHFRTLVDQESQARNQIKTELQEMNQRFEYMIQGNQSALWDWKDMTQDDVYWSPQLYHLLGYQEGEIRPSASIFMEHIVEESRQTSADALKVALQENSRLSSVIQVKRKDGKLLWLRTSGIVIRSGEDPKVRLVGSLDNISDLKERELELRAAKELAENSNLAKSQFLSHMSHEVRTPLNGILGYAELIQNLTIDENQHSYATVIVDCCHSLNKLINDILDYAKIESGHLELRNEVFNIHNLVEEVAKLFAVNFKRKSLDFHFKSSLQNNFYKADGFRIRQILTNLIGNAIKFTDKGEITVEIAETPNKMIRIKVKDTGKGIPLADQTKIFDAFYQIHTPGSKNHGGSGLGLTIVRQLIDLMGGEIHVQSSLDIGTTFDITFQIQPLKIAVPPKGGEDLPSIAPIGNLSVLVVDDNEVNLTLIKSILEILGIHADTAKDGEEAVLAIQEKNYDLVFMDINMPRLDGLAATKKIRETIPPIETKIYGISANAFAEDKEKAIASGMNGYLTKPITIESIRHVLVLCSPG